MPEEAPPELAFQGTQAEAASSERRESAEASFENSPWHHLSFCRAMNFVTIKAYCYTNVCAL